MGKQDGAFLSKYEPYCVSCLPPPHTKAFRPVTIFAFRKENQSHTFENWKEVH